jgi:Ca-activated chloride channel family protein
LQAYHQGIERYRQHDFDGAVELFSQAIGASHDELAAAARYNMATTLYAQAVQGLDGNQTTPPNTDAPPAKTDPEALLTQAIDAFRSALRLRPDWDDARANLEKSVRLLDQLRQQQKQHDQQQDQTNEGESSENSESDPQQSQSSESESSKSEESESKPSEQDQSSESESESSQTGQDSEGQPNESNESTAEESMSDSSGESPPNPSQAQQPPNNDSEPDDASSEENAESDAEQQTPPADASGELSSNNEDEPSAEPASGDAVKESQLEDQSMTPEEAQKMLQAVRDRDMIRRYRLQQMQRSRQIQVDRDW